MEADAQTKGSGACRGDFTELISSPSGQTVLGVAGTIEFCDQTACALLSYYYDNCAGPFLAGSLSERWSFRHNPNATYDHEGDALAWM